MAAMKEMKAKVVREFKKREGGKGMGKMKWDAQVRLYCAVCCNLYIVYIVCCFEV